ncbi:MAG: PPK2 family polyphosphate kinase [Planctomycetota bacterium]
MASPFLAPTDGSFSMEDAVTSVDDAPSKKKCKEALRDEVERLEELQRVLYAHDSYSVLCVFQAMDAAGKDSTIRAVFSGVNPAGFEVHSFKRPSTTELDHDFLWRTSKALPQRGRIGVFNRSYYEEVLVVKVHPGILKSQKLPGDVPLDERFEGRYASLREHEAHLARNGVVVVKFFLNVSKTEQARRFLDRLEEPSKNWKFEAGDMRERQHWDAYMNAYERTLQETSRHGAPWYAIPADDKPYMRWQVAKILRETLESLPLSYPAVDPSEAADFGLYAEELRREVGR